LNLTIKGEIKELGRKLINKEGRKRNLIGRKPFPSPFPTSPSKGVAQVEPRDTFTRINGRNNQVQLRIGRRIKLGRKNWEKALDPTLKGIRKG